MALQDTLEIMIVSSTAAESLPDPTTRNGQAHWLINASDNTTTYTSVGATPFQQNGVNVASITIPAASSKSVRSDGVRWVVVDAGIGTRRIYSATAVTDGAGNAVFTHNAPAFAVPPICGISVETANTNATEARITANSTTSTTVNVRQAPGVVILGISVLQVPQPLAGATVHLIAVEPGLT